MVADNMVMWSTLIKNHGMDLIMAEITVIAPEGLA